MKLEDVDGKYFTADSIVEFLKIEKGEVIETTKKILLLYKDAMSEFIDKSIEDATSKQKINITKE